VDYLIAETSVGGRRPVMHFVRMEDMALMRKTISLRAAISECLNAEQGHPYRIRIVTMRRKPLTANLNLLAFNSAPPLPNKKMSHSPFSPGHIVLAPRFRMRPLFPHERRIHNLAQQRQLFLPAPFGIISPAKKPERRTTSSTRRAGRARRKIDSPD
jgi:hypothetical protein